MEGRAPWKTEFLAPRSSGDSLAAWLPGTLLPIKEGGCVGRGQGLQQRRMNVYLLLLVILQNYSSEQLAKFLKSYSIARTNEYGAGSWKLAPGPSREGQLFVWHRSWGWGPSLSRPGRTAAWGRWLCKAGLSDDGAGGEARGSETVVTPRPWPGSSRRAGSRQGSPIHLTSLSGFRPWLES